MLLSQEFVVFLQNNSAIWPLFVILNCQQVKILKHIINWVVWTFISLYAVVMLAVRVPVVQQELGEQISELVGRKLGTKVEVGRVDLGFLNRLILDDVSIYDQHQKQLLKVARMTVKLDVAPLAVGRISVSSAQLFGARLQLYRVSKDAPANFQFALDSLAAKDTTSNTPLDLRVNSFIMRHSSVTYDEWDVAPTPDRLNTSHLNVVDISAHVILKRLTDDSLNVNVKRLTFAENSGINVRRLSFRMAAGRQNANINDFLLQLPASEMHLDSIVASYDMTDIEQSLCLKGKLINTSVRPSDVGSLLPELRSYHHKLAMEARFDYRDRTLSLPWLQVDADNADIALLANGQISNPRYGNHVWQLNIDRLNVADKLTDYIAKNMVSMPDEVLRLGNIQIKGSFSSDAEGMLHAQAGVTTDAGRAQVQLQLKNERQFSGHLATDSIDVGRIIANDKIGVVATNMDVNSVDGKLSAKGQINRLQYNGEIYTGIELDGQYGTGQYAGWVQISDPKLAARVELDIRATTLNNAVGVVSLHDLSLPAQDYYLDFLRLETGFDNKRHFVELNSDFAHADLTGDFDFNTLVQSVANAVGSKLPTLPGLPPYKPSNNNFTIDLMMVKTDWLQKLFDVDLEVEEPVSLSATVNDSCRLIDVDLQAPAFIFDGTRYQAGSVHVTSPADSLLLSVVLNKCQPDEPAFELKADGNAVDNNISLVVGWNNNDKQKSFSGELNLTSRLYRNSEDMPEAHVNILPSKVYIYNSVWQIEPSDLLYSTNRLLIDHFSVHNGEQYIMIDGTASALDTDTVAVDLEGVEVAYVLDLVGFDAVSFSGFASGRATVNSVFDDPDASARLKVSQFEFEKGRMGTLTALVDWNKEEEQIDIHAIANDGPDAMTYIDGYVSPDREYIDLGISAHGSYLDFMHSFTESFISHITGHGTGDLRLAGPLSAINLTGGLVVEGEATITPLNTTYRLKQDTIIMVYNEIQLNRIPIYDKFEHVAYLSGAVHHKDLTELSLDLHVDTDGFLGYDFPDFGENSFYGTVLASGTVDISMKGDDVRINCDVTPLKNTVFVYNAANPDVISSQEFITWKHGTNVRPLPQEGVASMPAVDDNLSQTDSAPVSQEDVGGGSNIYMNFHINTIPDATMRLLMDAKTGDYINLNGSGSIQATYYNKGTFQMFGTYTVDHGTYDLTIQKIIKKNFQFQPGGTITFGGDPYSSALNLQALYTVNGVSLSDLQLGNSFSSNTIRVNCLMNIGGQPSAPRITFDLDMPTVNADEKQMVRSLLSSQQEMNQQVLYLLGIGRFYSQGQNNAGQQQQDQTSLAMQSFLSGTLSTQINTVINQIVKNDDWNFGANISTGTEGWNNAEYEGIVNGRMLNNRLLINGQFGYRDNATQATSSFIGDFDVRYLLFPNGNLALKVYNQTNDRYFTRSSLNTQGVGIILKKDFNGIRDFFGLPTEEPTPLQQPSVPLSNDTLFINNKSEEHE